MANITNNMAYKILVIDDNEMMRSFLQNILLTKYEVDTVDSAEDAKNWLEQGNYPSLIVSDHNLPGTSGKAFMSSLKKTQTWKSIPFLILSGKEDAAFRIECLESGAEDFLVKPFHPKELMLRVGKILDTHSSIHPEGTGKAEKKFRLPIWKRMIDIMGSLTLILLLSPVFIGIAALIKMESEGPVFYFSKRTGPGFKVFNFYKFRSMRVNADKMVSTMKVESLYAKKKNLVKVGMDGGEILLQDDGEISEGEIKVKKAEKAAGVFFKVTNDPRITRVGKFIRNTSLDELPQLFNVLKGDMSLVGNRPLPLYEAELLTVDEWVERFEAPAGITGLWQVTERGKENTSEDSRKKLDIVYAREFNFWMDLYILVKTPIAAVQKVNV